MLWERCLAMAFILRKPSGTGQFLTRYLSGSRGALQRCVLVRPPGVSPISPVDDIHPYQSVRGRPLDELAGLVGNAALSDSIVQAAKAEILRLQTKAQLDAATATIQTATHNRRMVIWMVVAVVVNAASAVITTIVTVLKL
jgi:hypothetical protein